MAVSSLAAPLGRDVNISSIAAVRYTDYPYVAYYAAEAAENNFTMGLALQYAKDGISPGSASRWNGGLPCRAA